jgi:hypothetical protein
MEIQDQVVVVQVDMQQIPEVLVQHLVPALVV